MAKNNLFLGTASRSVGDVTLYRRNGKQISRVRVREVANPKSYKQALQRCFFAPVARFYAPLAACLERSWEGKNKSESYSAFLKKNIELSRSMGIYVPKGAPYLAFPYMVSKGTLPVTAYSWDENETGLIWLQGYNPADNTLGSLSQRLISEGYLNGDQVTIILFVSRTDDYLSEGVIPMYVRFFLDPESTDSLDSITGSIIKLRQFGTGAASRLDVTAQDGLYIAGGAIIMSRFEGDQWRRSTQSVVCDGAYLELFTDAESKSSAVDSYRSRSAEVQSDIYLNGSRIEGKRSVSESYEVTDNLGGKHNVVGLGKGAINGVDFIVAVFDSGSSMFIQNNESESQWLAQWLQNNHINDSTTNAWSALPDGATPPTDYIGLSTNDEIEYANMQALSQLGLTWQIWLESPF